MTTMEFDQRPFLSARRHRVRARAVRPALLSIVACFGMTAFGHAQQQAVAPVLKTVDLWIKDVDQFDIPLPLLPARIVKIVAPHDAYVSSIDARLGDAVQKGAVIIRLDTQRLGIELEAVTEQVHTLERALGTNAEDRLSLIEATKKLKLLKMSIDFATARTPLNGRLYEVFVSEGQFVRAGEPLAVVADPSVLEVRVPIAAGTQKRGDSISLNVGDGQVVGSVLDVFPLSKQLEKLYELGGSLAEARVTVDNSKGSLQVGALVRSDMIPSDSITRVPRATVQTAAGQSFVRVVRGDVVRYVTTRVIGQLGDNYVRVAGDFRPFDNLILEGPAELSDGTPLSQLSGTTVSQPGGARPGNTVAPAPVRRRAP